MISHDKAQSLISARYDEPLSPADTRDLQEHLASCPTCREFATDADLLINGLRTLPQMPPSPRVSRMVQAGIRDGAAPRGWVSQWLRVASSPGLAVASSLVLVAALAFIIAIALQPIGLDEQPRATISALADVIETPTTEPERTAISAPTVAPTELAVTAPTQVPTQEPTPEPTARRTNVVPPTRTPVPAETQAAVQAEPTVAPTERPILAQAQSTVPPVIETPEPTVAPPVAAAPTDVPEQPESAEPETRVIEAANEALEPEPTSPPIQPTSEGAPFTSDDPVEVNEGSEAPPEFEQPIIEQGGPAESMAEVPASDAGVDDGTGDAAIAAAPANEPVVPETAEVDTESDAESAPEIAADPAETEPEEAAAPAEPTSTPVQIIAAETHPVLPPPSSDPPALQPRTGNEAVSMSGDSMVAEIQATVQAGLNDDSGPPTFPPEPTAVPTTPPQPGQDGMTPASGDPGVMQPVGAEITGAPVSEEDASAMGTDEVPPIEGDPGAQIAPPPSEDPATGDPAAVDPAASTGLAETEILPAEEGFVETAPEELPVVPQIVGVPEPAWPGIGSGGTQFMSNAGYSAIYDGGGVSVYGPDGTPIGVVGSGIPVWSPGGTSVLVIGPDGLGAVWDPATGPVPVERPDAPARDIPVGWYDGSPLVHRLYFDGSGRSELRVVPVTGAGGYVLGAATTDSVFGEGVTAARLSPDGGQISFVSGGVLYIAPASDPGSATPAG